MLMGVLNGTSAMVIFEPKATELDVMIQQVLLTAKSIHEAGALSTSGSQCVLTSLTLPEPVMRDKGCTTKAYQTLREIRDELRRSEYNGQYMFDMVDSRENAEMVTTFSVMMTRRTMKVASGAAISSLMSQRLKLAG